MADLWIEREELHYRLRTRDLFCADLKADISKVDTEVDDRAMRAGIKANLSVELEKATAARVFEEDRLAQVIAEIAGITASLERDMAEKQGKKK